VVVSLRDQPAWAVYWCRPLPQLPPLLRQPSRVLRDDKEWLELVVRWVASPSVQRLLLKVDGQSASQISKLLSDALEGLIHLAGGWKFRPPTRKLAYESREVCRLRGSLRLFGECLSLLRREMREERVARWRGLIPQLWIERPGSLYRWLAADSPAWGSAPILTTAGSQCCSIEEVDAAVQAFWVAGVWRRHAAADEPKCWEAFRTSSFYAYYPHCDWPQDGWSLGRVRKVLRSMRESSSPGIRGFSIALWRSLPDEVLSRLADLLTLVEKDGRWPEELNHAYVTMIPKASGGSRPQDQRPTTVLDVLYRLWAKGVVLTWSPTLQGAYLT
jgi:hypothetical protein